MRVYFDSSSFAKRFIDEPGSDLVEKTCTNATVLGLSVICVPEIVSALNRRRHDTTLTNRQYNEAKSRLIEDIRDADIVNLTTAVVGTSVHVLERSSVRTLDALHVACGIEWEADLFVSSDTRQLTVAKEAGLNIQDV